MPPKHVKIYLKFHGYRLQSDVMCEVCGGPAVEIHHVTPKGMGGNPKADCIENLIGLCRRHHDIAHGKIKGETLTQEELYEIIEVN
jgi:5-methylcytosine-specific restriction endonuclease McrA